MIRKNKDTYTERKPLKPNEVSIYNNGYVRLTHVHGNETDIVNAARVSYDKEVSELGSSDIRLLKFLIEHGHTSPLRHVSLGFECYAPLMVARQHWKYVVASTFTSDQQSWNESSRRYITQEPEFYFPDAWRSAPDNSKQGSGPPIIRQDLANRLYSQHVESCERAYLMLLQLGIAPEQARLALPAYALMIRYRWTISLGGLMNFFEQRLADDAQKEIADLASACYTLVQPHFPNVLEKK